MIDRESCRLFIDTVYEEHYKHFHNDFGETFAGFFSDEPGFQNEKGNNNDSCIGKKMALPWSKELSKRLKENLGEQYLLELSALWYEEHNSPKIRYIYMDLCTQLYDECFTSQIGNWCREHHVEYIGHVIEDRDSNSRLGVGAGNIFRSMYGQDMAGVDIVLNKLCQD